MTAEQLFVGSVAFALGLLALTAAIHNHDWYYRLPKARWIESRWGRGAARITYALLGVIALILSAAIILGGGPN